MIKVGDRIIVDLNHKNRFHESYLEKYQGRSGTVQGLSGDGNVCIKFKEEKFRANKKSTNYSISDGGLWWCYIEDVKLDVQYYREKKLLLLNV